jgi:hypothetical protein
MVYFNVGRNTEYMKRWRKEHADSLSKYQRGYRETHPRRKYHQAERAARIKKLYGITQDGEKLLIARCGGCCEICGREFSLKNRYTIDHDHKTGLIRGLLCVKCNSGIGLLDDDKENLMAALVYLAREPREIRQ